MSVKILSESPEGATKTDVTGGSVLEELSQLTPEGRFLAFTAKGFENINVWDLLDEAEKRRYDGFGSRVAVMCPQTPSSALVDFRRKLGSMGTAEYWEIKVYIHTNPSTPTGDSDDVWDLKLDEEDDDITLMGSSEIHVYTGEFFHSTNKPIVSLSDRLQEEVHV